MNRLLIGILIVPVMLLLGCGMNEDSSGVDKSGEVIDITSTSIDWDNNTIVIEATNTSEKELILNDFRILAYDEDNEKQLIESEDADTIVPLAPGSSKKIKYKVKANCKMKTVFIEGYEYCEGDSVSEKDLFIAFDLGKAGGSTTTRTISNPREVKQKIEEMK